MVIPTPSTAASCSGVAAAMAWREPNSPGQQPGPRSGPTCRIDSATSTRHSGRVLAASRLSSSLRALAASSPSLRRKKSARARSAAVSENRSPSSVTRPAFEQGHRRLVAEHLDVEGSPAGDVEQPLTQLGRAGPLVGAADIGVALFLRSQFGAAFGAVGRHHEGPLGAVAQRHHRAEDLRDDVAGLAQHHRVADQHALARHLAGVVQGGHLDDGAGHGHRLHPPERGHPTGAPDVDQDVEQLGVHLFGRVLEGDRPSRRPAGRAQLALHRQRVDLDHHPVDLVLDVMAVLAVVLDVLGHLGHRGHHLGARRGRAGPTARRCSYHWDWVSTLGPPSTWPDPVHHHLQLAAGGDPRILLAQRSGRGVARVRVGRLALGHQPGVEARRTRSSGKYTSPRTSMTSGTSAPASRSGTAAIVRTLPVTSSPVRPSPRVAARTSRPRS